MGRAYAALGAGRARFGGVGDTTQFATIALDAKYASPTMVVLETTLRMMAANFPAVLLGLVLLNVRIGMGLA